MSGEEKDGLDRLFDAIETVQGTVKMVAADTEVTREMTAGIRDRVSSLESRMDVLERAEGRHAEWRKSASDEDAKIVSDQKAFVIALEETKSAAKEALEVAKTNAIQVAAANDNAKAAYDAARLAFEASRKGLTTLANVKTNTDEAKSDLATIKTEEQKRPKLAVTLAAILNLSIGLVYVILELLRSAGK